MIQAVSTSSLLLRRSRASGELETTSTLGSSVTSSLCLLLTTTFNRPGRGRNFDGIESQVFLPITTAFNLPSAETVLVNFEKLLSSDFSRQGRVPSLPIPPPAHMSGLASHPLAARTVLLGRSGALAEASG